MARCPRVVFRSDNTLPVPDAIFAHPRLAELYDLVDADRSDLDVYARVVQELGARRVLDVGCGTGTFACMLAGRDVEVVGVDPAAASLEVARRKPNADRVEWLRADAVSVPSVGADLATMTGNVAQVFLSDEDLLATFRAIRHALRPGGALIFESRNPEPRAWESWNRSATDRLVRLPAGGAVRTWTELTDVRLPFVSFRHVFEFGVDGTVLISDSTLRFRESEELADALKEAGFSVAEVREAPDRPGLEFVFIARRRDAAGRRTPAQRELTVARQCGR